MFPDQVVASRVKEYGEAPGIPECDDLGFSRVEIDVQGSHRYNQIASHLRTVQPRTLLLIQD